MWPGLRRAACCVLCAAVVLNVDNSCPNSLRNQEFVRYLFQAQPKGLVTLDFKQNGDYYISCAVSVDRQGKAISSCPHRGPRG